MKPWLATLVGLAIGSTSLLGLGLAPVPAETPSAPVDLGAGDLIVGPDPEHRFVSLDDRVQFETGQVSLRNGDDWLRLAFGEGSARPIAAQPATTRVSFYLGNEPSQWLESVPTSLRIRYEEVWPGIALEFSVADHLKYDAIVAPGADPRDLDFKVDGADRIFIDSSGDLVLETHHGILVDEAPVAWSKTSGESVAVAYELRGDDRFGFMVGAYDASDTLVIDPVLAPAASFNQCGATVAAPCVLESAILGGRLNETTADVAYWRNPANGHEILYLGGSTSSPDFTGPNAKESSNGARDELNEANQDMFMVKIDMTAETIEWIVFVGGKCSFESPPSLPCAAIPSEPDYVNGVTVDGLGRSYIGGTTHSFDFPVVRGFQPALGNGTNSPFTTNTFAVDQDRFQRSLDQTVDHSHDFYDGAIVRFTPQGTLDYSTYLGGSGEDYTYDITWQEGGTVVLSGVTASPDLPLPSKAYRRTYGGAGPSPPPGNGLMPDGFIAKVDTDVAGWGGYRWGTFLGGSHGEQVTSVKTHNGKILAMGFEASEDFPTTPGASFQDQRLQVAHKNNSNNVFLSVFSPDGAGEADLDYVLFLARGGYGQTLSVTPSGLVLVTSSSQAHTVPMTVGAIRQYGQGEEGALWIVDPFAPVSQQYKYGTFFGSSGGEFLTRAHALADGRIYLIGQITPPADYPFVGPPLMDGTAITGARVAVAVLSPNAAGLYDLSFSSQWGGRKASHLTPVLGSGSAVTDDGRLVLVGVTDVANLPRTDWGTIDNRHWSSAAYDDDVFVTVFRL